LEASISRTMTFTSWLTETSWTDGRFSLSMKISETCTNTLRCPAPAQRTRRQSVMLGSCRKLGPDRILGIGALPRVRLQLFHAERYALGGGVELGDHDLYGLAECEHFRRWLMRRHEISVTCSRPSIAAHVDERARNR